MNDYDKPSEMTYRHYREKVEFAAEVAYDRLEESASRHYDMHEAVHDTIDGDQLVMNYGYMLKTVLLSDQSPDSPDHSEPWTLYCDLSDPSWADAVGAMAYVCYDSDVMEQMKRMEEDSQ